MDETPMCSGGCLDVLRFVAGIVSMFLAVLSALRATLDYESLYARHRLASLRYVKVRRKIEDLIEIRKLPLENWSKDGTQCELHKEWAGILHEMDDIEQQSPIVRDERKKWEGIWAEKEELKEHQKKLEQRQK